MSDPKPSTSLRSFIRESQRRGSFYFHETTMSFFDSKVHGDFYELSPDDPYAGYFITSERHDMETPRFYTIRFAQNPTEISTASEFCEYETYEEAKNALSEFIYKAVTANKSPLT